MLCFKLFWIFQYISIVFKLNCPNSLGSQKEFNRIPPSVDLHWFTALLLSLPGLLLWGAITPWDALILLLDATYTRECSATDQDCTEMTLCCISRSWVKKWRIGMSPLPLSLEGKSGHMTTFLLKVANFSTKLGLSFQERSLQQGVQPISGWTLQTSKPIPGWTLPSKAKPLPLEAIIATRLSGLPFEGWAHLCK